MKFTMLEFVILISDYEMGNYTKFIRFLTDKIIIFSILIAIYELIIKKNKKILGIILLPMLYSIFIRTPEQIKDLIFNLKLNIYIIDIILYTIAGTTYIIKREGEKK